MSITLNENEDLMRRNTEFKEYNNELLDKLSDAELDKETVSEERDNLLAANNELEAQLAEAHQLIKEQNYEIGRLQQEITNKVSFKAADEDKYLMFSRLMDAFEEERKEWRKRNTNLQTLLMHATNDILYLTKKNEEAKEVLTHAVRFEAPIQPSKINGFR